VHRDSQLTKPGERAIAEATARPPSKRRAWLISVFLIAGCSAAVLLYWLRPVPASNTARATAKEVDPRPAQTSDSKGSGPELRPITVATANPEAPGTASHGERFWEMTPKMRGAYLSGADPSALASTLDSLAGKDKENALQTLREIINDPAQSAREEVLQLLLGGSKIDDDTMRGVFTTALHDPNVAMTGLAVGLLAARNDEQAVSTLSSAYNEGDASTRLLIVEALSSESAAAPILQKALSDADEDVRYSASSILSSSQASGRSETRQ